LFQRAKLPDRAPVLTIDTSFLFVRCCHRLMFIGETFILDFPTVFSTVVPFLHGTCATRVISGLLLPSNAEVAMAENE
jgi:hypothetical protein